MKNATLSSERILSANDCNNMVMEGDVAVNYIPPLFRNPDWGSLATMTPQEFRTLVVESESQIRLPTLLTADRARGLETANSPEGVYYQRNGYYITGYKVPEEGISQDIFSEEESIGIRAFLAAQYLHEDLQFFDIEVAQEARFLMESITFFHPGDIVLLVVNEEGQIVSHLGIEGPIEKEKVSLGDFLRREKLHYLERVYQDPDGLPTIHTLINPKKNANSLREIRRFSIRHDLLLPSPIERQLDIMGTNIGEDLVESYKTKLKKAERIVIALETVMGLTQAVPLLEGVEEELQEDLVFIMDTNENIVRLFIKGLLGIIPKSGKPCSLLEDSSIVRYIDQPHINLESLEFPYNNLLKPRYDPSKKGHDVALRLFTLSDVKTALSKSMNGKSRKERINDLLAEYAESQSVEDKLYIYRKICKSFGVPLPSELMNPMIAYTDFFIRELKSRL